MKTASLGVCMSKKPNMPFYPTVPILSFKKIRILTSVLPLILRITKQPDRLDLVIKLYGLLYTKEYLASLEADLKSAGLRSSIEKSANLEIPNDEILSKMPKGSLGYEFYQFKQKNNLNPDDAKIEVQSEYSDLFLAFSKTHDVWHVLTGFDTSEEGEIGLQAFYLSQHATPLAALLISLGLLRSLFFGLSSFVKLFESACLGWQKGRSLRQKLISLNLEEKWVKPLSELQSELTSNRVREPLRLGS